MLTARGPGKSFYLAVRCLERLQVSLEQLLKGVVVVLQDSSKILRLDFRKQGRHLGKESKQSLRDQSICFHLMYKAISVH